MNMIKKVFFAIVLSLCVTPAFAAKDYVLNVFNERMQFEDYVVVQLSSNRDGLIINSVQVNRGYCKASYSNPRGAIRLDLGRTVAYRYMTRSHSCQIAEIIINTNKGEMRFTPR